MIRDASASPGSRTTQPASFPPPTSLGHSPMQPLARSRGPDGERSRLELRFERETCRALPSVLKPGGPSSALLRGRACLELPGVCVPPRLLGARHLADHEVPGRNLFANVFELGLVSFAIPLESRLLHCQSVAVSKHMACCDPCSDAHRASAEVLGPLSSSRVLARRDSELARNARWKAPSLSEAARTSSVLPLSGGALRGRKKTRCCRQF